MNVFRSLARSLWRVLAPGQSPPGRDGATLAPGRSRLQDGFDRASRSSFRPAPQGDGFDGGVRSPPVDLTGGVRRAYLAIEAPPPPPAIIPSDFVASLDDLTLVLGPAAELPPLPPVLSTAGLVPVEDAALVADATEPAPAASSPLVELGLPPALEGAAGEGLLQLSDFAPVVDAFELAPSAAPATSRPLSAGLLTADAFEPVVDAFEPAPVAAPPAPAMPQHPIEPLMPATSPAPVRPQAVEQFSTVALLDLVAKLSPQETPAEPLDAAPAVSTPESTGPTGSSSS